jgi:hypothetical protein
MRDAGALPTEGQLLHLEADVVDGAFDVRPPHV